MKLTTKYNLKEHGFVLVDNFYSNEEIESFKFVNSDFEYPFQDEEAKGAEIIFDFSKVKQYAKQGNVEVCFEGNASAHTRQTRKSPVFMRVSGHLL